MPYDLLFACLTVYFTWMGTCTAQQRIFPSKNLLDVFCWHGFDSPFFILLSMMVVGMHSMLLQSILFAFVVELGVLDGYSALWNFWDWSWGGWAGGVEMNGE